MPIRHLPVAAVVLAAAAALSPAEQPSDQVTLLRVPHRGIQPHVAVDGQGVVHLVYYAGRPAAGDVYYARSTDGGATFSSPVRVNSQPGSAIAVGNIRGPQLALGKGGRVHVAWNGSSRARPAGPRGASPMLYARLNDAGTAFEPQRNVIAAAYGLDGGGTVAADGIGHVYVLWHAPPPGVHGWETRRVWVARSEDDGRTFAPEQPASPERTGACGCCGMGAFAGTRGTLLALYRSAPDDNHRAMYLLASTDSGRRFDAVKLQDWDINGCPMSSEAFARAPGGYLAAWETRDQVYWARLDSATGKPVGPALAAPGEPAGRKHPALAVNARGEMLLAWTEGMGWERGGTVAWQVYDRDGRLTRARGRADGVPVWGLVAAFARPDGGFTVVY